MKKFFLAFLICLSGFSRLYAQNPFYELDVREPAVDTVLSDLLGVISGPLPPPGSPLPDISPQLLDIGVTSIRNNGNYNDKLDMEAMFRCPGSPVVPAWHCSPDDEANYHFSASDSLFRVIHNNGFNSFFRVGGEVQSALPDQHHVFHGPQDTLAENNWIRAAVKVVEHYDNFEGEHNLLPYLDIWTEWPNPEFWERPNDEFIWFFLKTLDTLKSHFPGKKIGGPGFLVPTVQIIHGQVHTKAFDLLNALYTHGLKPDFVSWHLWQMDPLMYYEAGEQIRNLLDGTGDFTSVPWAGSGFFDGVEILCGAYGVPKMDGNTGEEFSADMKYLLYNTQKGASLLTADWIAMQYGNTVKAFYYRSADPVSDPDTTLGLIGGSGIFYGNSSVTYKPLAYAFKLWSGFFTEFPHKLECDFPLFASDSSKLWALPAKNIYGGYGILVANTDSVDKTFSVSINGLMPDTSIYDIYCHKVNNDNDGSTAYVCVNNTFDIGLQTVELIRIVPKNYPSKVTENDIPEMKIFPNPADDFITVNSEYPIDRIQITEITGKVVEEIFPCEKYVKLNIALLPPGIYFLKSEIRKKTVFTKFVVNGK